MTIKGKIMWCDNEISTVFATIPNSAAGECVAFGFEGKQYTKTVLKVIHSTIMATDVALGHTRAVPCVLVYVED